MPGYADYGRVIQIPRFHKGYAYFVQKRLQDKKTQAKQEQEEAELVENSAGSFFKQEAAAIAIDDFLAHITHSSTPSSK
jgi:hypothetical protein